MSNYLTAAVIGARLREARLARGLTQAQAAEVTGVGVRLWNEVERGKRTNVSLVTMLAMLDLVGVDVLLDGRPVPAPEPVATTATHGKAPPPAATADGAQRPIRSGDRIATGTGAARRRLTVAEAEAGGLPERMTRAEWDAMADASRAYHNRLLAEGASWWRRQGQRVGVRTTVRIGPDLAPSDEGTTLEQRAVSRIRAGESVYRVAKAYALPYPVVFGWALAAGLVSRTGAKGAA